MKKSDDIKAFIKTLSPEDQEAIGDLAEHIKHAVSRAGPAVGFAALALVGAECEEAVENVQSKTSEPS